MAAAPHIESTRPERVVRTVYPSIAATGLGRLIGGICGSIPLTKNISLSAILFGPLLAPLGALVYVLTKAFGSKYVISSQSVSVWGATGTQLQGRASLDEVSNILIDEQPGQAFFHAADVVLQNADGDDLLRLPGVSRPEVVRHAILEVRDAGQQVGAALATINARQPA